MSDAGTLGVLVSLVAVNLACLGLILRALTNGRKPRQPNSGNPGPQDPRDIKLGDVPLSYFEECLERQTKKLVEAIETTWKGR